MQNIMNEQEKFLKKLNEAFAQGNINYIIDNVTDDIQWNIIGEDPIRGKEAFTKAMQEMEVEAPMNMSVTNTITQGNMAAVEGTMRPPNGKAYAFCDVYKFSGFKKPKVKEMTSYVLELKKELV